MAFHDMPDLGPQMLEGSAEYARWAIEESKRVAGQQRVVWDVPYGQDFFQKLDLFLPHGTGQAGLPVLLFLHGGAWRHGFKEWNGFMAPHFTSLPAIFVSANHRLAPSAKFPKPLEDVAAALAWVRENIAAHGGDPARIFVGGHSSGGHLAALAALRYGGVKACFPISAPLDLRLERCEPGGRRERVIRNFLDHAGQDREASAVTHVRGNRTPFFLAWGQHDLPELVEQNQLMLDLLRQEGCVVQHEVLAANHFDTHRGCIDPRNPWVRTVQSWMTAPG